ncbi:MAG: ribosome-associated translation inhibitor RaiA [Erysipelotrichaceae bacterium]|nr:ribosome-associated translation inhibitor RaiA [Erysipelotrichaceae bacterium]
MKVNVHGKDLTISQDMIERIGDKLSFLDKYVLIDPSTVAQVVGKKHGNDIKLEITIPTKIGLLRSEVVDHEIRNAIDDSIDKLEDQLRRQKTRLSRRHKEKLSKTFIVEEPAVDVHEDIVRTKRVIVDAMETEEAITQMELLGHTFFAYRDVQSGLINIVYKRNDGGYGVIETA